MNVMATGTTGAVTPAGPEDLDALLTSEPSATSWRRMVRRFAANRFALVGLIVLIVLALAAIAAPLITPASYDDTRYVADTYAFPSAAHWFGVDAVGRDFFSRNVYAIRVSLAIGLGAALISALIGTVSRSSGRTEEREPP